MRYDSYLRNAATILGDYSGDIPFHAFIKNFFSAQKKFGATDRRTITHLCYSYFRLGKALPSLQIEERILLSLLLCSNTSNSVLKAIKPEWDELTAFSLAEKISKLPIPFFPEEIFPWKDNLSGEIDYHQFCRSFLSQPKLFLRTRPGHEKTVLAKLQAAGISFKSAGKGALMLPPASKIDQVLELDREAVVQDLSSQQIAEFFPKLEGGALTWDCCAGSGGKSILLYDEQPTLKLTATDKRDSIIANLKLRFREAGIRQYQSFVTDLEKDELPTWITNKQPFDFIMADVPCTGSGTWARTPEQLFYYDPSVVSKYQILQRKILQRAIPQLAKGHHLLYITCSVFRQENEENIEWAVKVFGLRSKKMGPIKGYAACADTMFAALLTL